MPRILTILLVLPTVAQAQTETLVRDPVAQNRCAGAQSRFGCANAANIAAMAAPEDLSAGRPLGPARGAQEAAAVQRLDADKVKDLRREGTQTGGGSQP